VERSAGASFRSIPELAWIADDNVMSVEAHREYIGQGTSWVAVFNGRLVGFLCAERTGEDLHIWELAVHQACQGQGIGRRLIETAVEHARASSVESVTLTTFRDVPWNEPFYQRIGFKTLDIAETGARLERILAKEVGLGLPGERRCAMRLTTATEEQPK
jgi:GNAT superfamily N-acetyltransferase